MSIFSEADSQTFVSIEVDPRYPRPQFVRKGTHVLLDGPWGFAFDDHNVGLAERWFQQAMFPQKIFVPFVYESALSGVHETGFHDVVWYQRSFTIPEVLRETRIVLHFGAVDYACQVWVNGQSVGCHVGGHVSFSIDCSSAIDVSQENHVVVRVEDRHRDLSQPRGKQYWKRESESIFYTRTTGIWQSVWLEGLPPVSLESVQITPDVDRRAIHLRPTLAGAPDSETDGLYLDVSLEAHGTLVGHARWALPAEMGPCEPLTIEFHGTHGVRLWSPEDPFLYQIHYRLERDQDVLDRVDSYVGMRKISVKSGQVCLNGAPYFLKMVLDQGYFPDGILTAAHPAALKRDVELIKSMGFNGVRKHQKIEDPRWLSWCDQIGLLVWEEMPNSQAFTDQSVKRIVHEWTEVILRDYNHPCIMAWVPINESWGVPDLFGDIRQPSHLATMYYLTKSLDSSRLVISNDGWEHAISDLLTIHDYEGRASVLAARYQDRPSTLAARPAGRAYFVPGFAYADQPILITEMGGIAYQTGSQEGWGYTAAESDHDFLKRFQAVIQAIGEAPAVSGFCYTQFTDVEQEINGILTDDRQPKVALDAIREVVEKVRRHA